MLFRSFEKGKNQNILRSEDIEKIVRAYKDKTEIKKYCHIATIDEIKENDYNLNIPRYIDTFEEIEKIDLKLINKRIKDLEYELIQAKNELNKTLSELDI